MSDTGQRRVSGGAMYDPARDAWADRDADAGTWPQRRSVDQQPSPAQAPPLVSPPVHAVPVPIPGPGPVSGCSFCLSVLCGLVLPSPLL